MIVRIDSSSSLAVVKMALEFAAKQGFAVDLVAGNQPRIERSVRTVKAAPKAPKVPAVKKATAVKKTESAPTVPEELMAEAKGLRIIAEAGPVKFPKEVYGALRSKNVEKLTKAIAEARSLLSWDVSKTESQAHLHAELHKEFLHENPLLSK